MLQTRVVFVNWVGMIRCHEPRPNIQEFLRPLMNVEMLVRTETILNYMEQEEKRAPAKK